MRWYRLFCIDCNATRQLSPETVYCEHRVVVSDGVVGAFQKAREDGFWPLEVVETDWMPGAI